MAVGVPIAFAQSGVSSDPTRPATAIQTYVPTLTFDVASVRQSAEADSYTVSGSFLNHSSSFRATNLSTINLLALAFGVRGDQVLGMPDWRVMFDIQAKSDSAADERLAKLSKDQERLEQQHMMQVLLADRFKLRVHWETREGPTYDLVVSKKGPKLGEAKGEPPSPEQIRAWGDKPIPHLYQQGDGQVGYDYIGNGCSVEDIAAMLARQFGRPVSDKTGLTGKYDFTLRYHGTRLSDRSADDMDSVPPLDVAIQDQLGLKLEPAKGPVRFLVIDHIEKPSKN
jgi:uncharacterized protein (TIGR03435 family)